MSDQHIIGTDGDDYLIGADGNDWLEGLAGNDILFGYDGNDLLDGGGGDDRLLGGAGDDVYVSVLGGVDYVSDYAGFDELRLEGISPDQVERVRPSGSSDLILRVAATGDQITLAGWFYDSANAIERIVFDDGTVWAPAETSALRYLGTPGGDFLMGTQYDETFEGRGGTDNFSGSAGNDTYVLGDLLFDSIYDFSGDDEVRLPAGVSPDQVERVRQEGSDHLILRVAGTGEQLTVFNWFVDPTYQIERVVFDDSTVWAPGQTSALRYLGTAGNDILQGMQYDELLDGRAGADTMVGGAGDDRYVVDDFADVVVEVAGEGIDSVESSWLTYTLPDDVENLTLVGEAVSGQGNAASNIIIGNDLGNGIGGGSGDDVLIGGGGDDYINDMIGNDRFVGGAGSDIMVGQDGNDVYEPGLGGFDRVFDTDGDDELRMPSGVSPDEVERIRHSFTDHLVLRIAGSTEEVSISQWFLESARQIERVVFEDGTVWDPATAASLRYLGTAGDDYLTGSYYDELLEGREGNDVLSGQGGADTLVGGAGADTYVFFSSDGAGDTALVGAGDRLYLPDLSRSSVLMTRDASNLYITVQDTGASITLQSASGLPGEEGWRITLEFGDGSVWTPENVVNTSPYIGTNADDVLNGSEFGDQIFALGGNDVVHGNDGHDVFYGGAGQDTLHGGAGNDYYYVADGGDTIVENAGEGHDAVESSVSFSLAANVEDLFLTGAAPSGTGNELGNALVGNAADNILSGNGGNDIITSLEGNDVLDGGWGADAMHGGAGNDRYVVDDSFDRVFENAGEGVDTVESSIQYLLESTLENLTLTGTAVNGTGNELGNVLVGNAAANILYAHGGNDALSGMAGNDILSAGAGDDELLGGDGSDSLYGDAGDDLLDGGAGGDDMQGGPGNDTYLFARGSGFDVVWEFLGTAADTDIVLLSADIAPSDVTVEYTPPTQQFFNDGGFLLRINGGSDVLKIVWSPTTGREIEIEEVRFADATVWDETALAAEAIENGDAPVLETALADQAATEDTPFTYQVPADAFDDIDIAIGDSLTYSATLADGSALPSWLAFDGGTRTFSGTPANGDVGTISVRVAATDESGRSAADEFDFTVANTNDAPTVAVPISDQSAQDTVAFSFTVPMNTFADVDAGDALTYSAGMLPAWLSFNAATRTFSGTPGEANIGAVDVEVRATDTGGSVAADVFRISVGPAPDRTITGTSGNDTLAGASGNDTINGLAGADSMSGGLGNDSYFVDNAGDQVIEASGAGIDTVNSSISYTLGANVENLTLTGTANRNATGNALDNVLAGNSGSNTLAGLAGNDTYIVTQSNDNVVESSGNGIDTVRASISYTLGNNVEKLVLTGSSNINGTGNSLANSLTGNSGNNTLRGQGGTDILSGGAGNDILTGGSGTDEFYFGEAPGAGGVDRITDFSAGERLQFEEFVFAGIGAPGDFAPDDARFYAAPGASGGADASDRVVYNTTNGHLYYDADGSGAGAATLIAILDNAFALSASDIGVL